MRNHVFWPLGIWASVLLLLILASCSTEKQEAAPDQNARTGADPAAGSEDEYKMVVPNANPILTKYEKAPYPPQALPDSAEGVVEIRVKVLTDGTVGEKIIKARVHPLCDATALSSAGRCKFIPARKDGEFVEAWVTLKFPFKWRPGVSRSPFGP